MGMGTGLPPALKKFIQKKKQKKKAANPNLRPGTKQSRKNLLKKVMEKTPRRPARPKRMSPEETAKRREARQDVLEENIANIRRGTGRRSLLRGSGGGIGFYNRYNL